MRNRWCALSLFCCLVGGLGQHAVAKSIEAIPGKRYLLTDKHGPWMVMVTSLEDKPGDEGNAALEAADQMVYQLRRRGIPAYVYQTEEVRERFASRDPLGQEQRRVTRAQAGMVAVLAGNYKDADAPLAKSTLAEIRSKKLNLPVMVKSPETGKENKILFNFQKAFLSRNPLQGLEETTSKVKDPLILKMNSGVDHSLLGNKGKYSLVVASMYGTSQVKAQGGNKTTQKLGGLELAEMEAWQLCQLLNSNQKLKQLGMQAYVYHDRNRSIVTVGSFDTKDDPEIKRATEVFQAKYARNPNTQEDFLKAEWIHLEGKPGAAPLKSWVFDPIPKLIDVPTK